MTISIILTTVLFTIFMLRFVGFCDDKNKLQKNLEEYERRQKLKEFKRKLKNNN